MSLFASGSEDNTLYVYMKGISKPLLSHKFEGPQNLFVSPNPTHDVLIINVDGFEIQESHLAFLSVFIKYSAIDFCFITAL